MAAFTLGITEHMRVLEVSTSRVEMSDACCNERDDSHLEVLGFKCENTFLLQVTNGPGALNDMKLLLT